MVGLNVAPYTGAWIETYRRRQLFPWVRSHPIRVRGLKLIKLMALLLGLLRRTLYGCVD